MRVQKWYLDMVTADRHLRIGYVARVKWGLLSLPYSECMQKLPGEGLLSQHSTRTTPQPRVADAVRWQSTPLGCDARWQPLLPEIQPQVLLEQGRESVTWHCRVPAARVSWNRHGETLHGLGYVEFLDLSIAPWKLPLTVLHWGRFIGEAGDGSICSLVWIEWEGAFPLTRVFWQGAAVPGKREEEKVSFDGGELRLEDREVVREGVLSETAEALPMARLWVPRTLLESHETKWVSRGHLALDGGVEYRGFAVHEIVHWKSGGSP